MAAKPIVGPVVDDMYRIGAGDMVLATAFYSAAALDVLDFEADSIQLLVRLDTDSVVEWATGAIDPKALCRFLKRHSNKCDVALAVNPTAHAKLYRGDKGYLIGSANLSGRALSGNGNEILWFEDTSDRKKLTDQALAEYSDGFSALTLDALEEYVASNEKDAKALAQQLPKETRAVENEVPAKIVRPLRLGAYGDFYSWLGKQAGDASAEVLARADGKQNLSGHVQQSFYGLRQFYIRAPKEMHRLSSQKPEAYSFLKDASACSALTAFIKHDAVDEDAFKVSKWRTYLPEKAGGREKTGGGASGTLNRLAPLLARYMKERIQNI